METILLVFLLNLKSSYLHNSEEATEFPADTVQFMLVGGQAWRIKTFAKDHDVHVWSLGPMESRAFEELAITNTEKNYGDVLADRLKISSNRGMDELAAEVKGSRLGGSLETAKDKAFAFWVSAPNLYKTKSSPQ